MVAKVTWHYGAQGRCELARDLEDARGVVLRKGGELDWTYLEHWVDQFASVPGREELPHQLAELKRSVE